MRMMTTRLVLPGMTQANGQASGLTFSALGHRHNHRTERWQQSSASVVCTVALRCAEAQWVDMESRQSRYSDIRNIPQRSTATDAVKAATPVKREESKGPSAAALPPVSMSQVDVNAIPIHKGTGKPITQVNIDEGQ